MTDTLKADSVFADVNVKRHAGEVNILMFNNPAYWQGLISLLPFVLVKYQGRTGVNVPNTIKTLYQHEVEFKAYVATTSTALESGNEAIASAEILLARIFDLWSGRMFYSTNSFASNILVLNSTNQITTAGFKQFRPLMESGGQDEKLVMMLPEITLYETRYNARLSVYAE